MLVKSIKIHTRMDVTVYICQKFVIHNHMGIEMLVISKRPSSPFVMFNLLIPSKFIAMQLNRSRIPKKQREIRILNEI